MYPKARVVKVFETCSSKLKIFTTDFWCQHHQILISSFCSALSGSLEMAKLRISIICHYAGENQSKHKDEVCDDELPRHKYFSCLRTRNRSTNSEHYFGTAGSMYNTNKSWASRSWFIIFAQTQRRRQFEGHHYPILQRNLYDPQRSVMRDRLALTSLSKTAS